VVKFDFNKSKLRKRPFFVKHLIEKCQISKSKGGLGPCSPPAPVMRVMCLEQTREYIAFLKSLKICFLS